MLYKNVFRTLKKQYIQLLLLGVIITSSSFIYSTMDYGVSGILNPTEEYFEISNQEDFAVNLADYFTEQEELYLSETCLITEQVFTLSMLKQIDKSCYYNILDNRLSLITSQIDDIVLEVREYKDIFYELNGNTTKARILKDMSVINKSFMVSGNKPINSLEIAISEAYAKNNNLKINDEIIINNETYTISGFVLFPDYSLAMFGDAFIFDNKSQTVALVTDDDFENFDEQIQFEVGGTYTNYTEESFKTEVIDKYYNIESINTFVTNMIQTKNNMRSGAIYGEIEGGQVTGLGLSVLIIAIGILIVAIMVSKILEKQRGAIGILKSLGYKNSEIALPYVFYISILALPTLIFGYFIGYWFSDTMKNLYLLFYLLPSQNIDQNLMTFFISVIVPFAFLFFFSYLVIRKILNQKPVDLLNPTVSSNKNKLTMVVSKLLGKKRVTKKLKHLLLYRSLMKFTVYLIGLFYAAFLIYFSFSMVNIFDRMLLDYYDNTNYNYVGFCEEVCPSTIGNQDKVITIPSALLNNSEVSVVGIDTVNFLHPLLDMKNDDITTKLDDGIIITKSLALIKNIKVNDSFSLKIGQFTFDVTVKGITKEYSGSKIYINRELLSTELFGTDGYYNSVYSDIELSDEDYALILSNDKILEQSEEMQKIFGLMIGLLMYVSILIGGIIIYILTALTIEDNFYNISLFKVIGYNENEINKMILGGYSLYGNIIFLITVPITFGMLKLMEVMMARYYELILPLQISWYHIILALVINNVVFFIAAFSAKRKLKKVSLQEAMKMYQV
ncbi:hypothetical protein CI105_07920 [Candidatus Izimaplasma bacterium ZiA1]|uniref:ABC transporter permease n=1 Tax=Candidatus Izimoplasma sp. ZiA1 TaxID=2024899 RepID=UPI000BAA61FE|nr:hypothetical protein CI105_07920 [Candidatus Izimaplasma bacterium ZiA1]